MMTANSSALANLQLHWPELDDLDRAKAVRTIKRSGVSVREIARHLPVSEALLRHLLQALQAQPEDQILARRGKISTNDLIRRAKAARTNREVALREAEERKRVQKSIAGCKAICKWLVSEGLSVPCSEQIIGEARRGLAIAEQNGRLPNITAPAKKSVSKIIQLSRPPEENTDETIYVAWFALWLRSWAFYSMPDSWVRYKAIELALSEQYKR
jgi:transposase-like protein